MAGGFPFDPGVVQNEPRHIVPKPRKVDPVKFFNSLILGSLLVAAAAAADAPAADVPATDAPASLPEVGKAAPAFQLPAQTGDTVKLNQFNGKWVVLYFYPRDMTSGCTIEAHNFQRDLPKFEKLKAVVLGVSVDNVDSHQAFCTKEDLHFKLLADTDFAVTTAYGVLKEREGTKYAGRVTFLIDPKGVVRKVYDKVDVAKHSEEILADLAALQKVN